MSEHIWHVEIGVKDEGDRTRVDAVLKLADQSFHAIGSAKRAPGDPSVPVIGEDLAVARALSDLSHQLLHTAAARIEAFEGHPVKIHS